MDAHDNIDHNNCESSVGRINEALTLEALIVDGLDDYEGLARKEREL